MPIKCYFCGSNIPDNEAYCPNCGRPVAFSEDEIAATKNRNWAAGNHTPASKPSGPSPAETTPIRPGIPGTGTPAETTPISSPGVTQPISPVAPKPTTPKSGIPGIPGTPASAKPDAAAAATNAYPSRAYTSDDTGNESQKETSTLKYIISGAVALIILAAFLWFYDPSARESVNIVPINNIAGTDLNLHAYIHPEYKADADRIGFSSDVTPILAESVVRRFRERNYLPSYSDSAQYTFRRLGIVPGTAYHPYIVFRKKNADTWMVMHYVWSEGNTSDSAVIINPQEITFDHNPEAAEIALP